MSLISTSSISTLERIHKNGLNISMINTETTKSYICISNVSTDLSPFSSFPISENLMFKNKNNCA